MGVYLQYFIIQFLRRKRVFTTEGLKVVIQVEKKYEDHKISSSYSSQFDILGIWNSETFCQIKDV